MATTKRKRCTLSADLKLKILEALKSKKAEEVAKDLNIGYSTVKKLRLREEGTRKIELRNGTLKRRQKRGSTDDVSEALVTWFRQMKAQNALVNGPIMLERAKQLAVTLGHEDFEPSHSWLERLKSRYRIKFTKVSGERAISDEASMENWTENDCFTETVAATEETNDVPVTASEEQSDVLESVDESGSNSEVKYLPIKEIDIRNRLQILIEVPTLMQEQDEYDVFANHIASNIRNLKSEYLRKKMKREIQQVMLEIKEEEGEEEEEEHNLNNI